MLLQLFLVISSIAAPVAATPPAMEPRTPLAGEVSTPALSPERRGELLVERIVEICEKHPEVERAFLMNKPEPDGSKSYMFIPIFDRKVSDGALDEADAAYRALFPSSGHLPTMLLARNTWKKTLGSAPPIYVRPGK